MAFCHNDLGAEHLLADQKTGIITGAIDWADAAVTDPARDLAMIYRDLGPRVFDRTLAQYGGGSTAPTERSAFYARCKLLEDLAYGSSTPAGRYAKAALACLAHTFA